MSSLAPAIQPTVAKGIARQWPVPACSLAVADLRRLFETLQTKASEAATEQVAFLQKPQEQTDAQFAVLQNEVRGLMALVVRIQGASGEWAASTSIEAIREESLPAVIVLPQLELERAFFR